MKRSHVRIPSLLPLLAVLLAGEASAYQIFRPNPAGQAVNPANRTDYIINAPANAPAPFVHWDLREMPNCQVPWSVAHPVPDLDRNGTENQAADQLAARAAFDAGWNGWAGVNPATIGFILGDFGAGVGARTGIAIDGYNLLSFGGPAHDDNQCVVPPNAAPAPGGVAANRPYAPVVAPGADGLLATIPDGDDQVSLCLVDGGNAVANARARLDVQVVAVGAAVADSDTIVIAGADGILDSAPLNGEVIHGTAIIEQAGGNGIANSRAADDVQVIAVAAAVPAGCGVVVTAGPDGMLQTPTTGDDAPNGCIVAGGDGNSNTTALNSGINFPCAQQDDVQNIAIGNAAAPGAIVVSAGGDGVLTTAPRGDDVIVGNSIREPAAGGNGRADTDAGNQGTNCGNHGVLGGLGLTGLFFNNQTGVIIEADVEFNASYRWTINAHGAVPPAGTFDLQHVAMHEFGHCIGLAHPINGRSADDVQSIPVGNAAAAGAVVVSPGGDGALATQPAGDDVVVGNTIREPAAGGNGTADTPRNNSLRNDPPPANIMNPFVQGPPNACNQQLSSDDQAGCNFLYTADLGDGKDPYQVKIRNAAGTGRNLSGVPLASVRNGPFHLLGTPQPSGLGGPAPARFSRFEWLGPNEDGNAAECGPRQVNQDLFDDGMIVPGGSLDIGTTTRVRVLVSTNDREPAGRYNPGTPTQQLYFNGYFDFNADQTFNNADLEIWWQGVPGTTDDASANFNAGASNLGANPMVLAFDLAVPSSVSNDTIWTRARLDYGEDEGRVANVNGDLAPAQGVAQFGEVEDSFAHGVATIANVLCPPDDIVTPGDSLELQFCIEGKGGLAFEYDWLLTEQHGWLVSANPGATGSFFVEPGMSLCITAKVKVPDDCEEGTTDTLCFLITPSGGSPNYNSDTCCVVLQCTGPTPTLLSRFEGVPSASSVRLSFTVPDESDVLGFHVYRSERESGDGVRVTSEPVAASGRRSYELTDSDVRPATGYWYAVSAIGFDGSEQRLGRISVRTPAAVFALGRPEPTPSHAGFSLDFALPRSGRARLTLFDISGREVASLLDETLPAGDHTLRWNGRGRDGRALQGGVYFVVFESAGRRAVTRAVLMR